MKRRRNRILTALISAALIIGMCPLGEIDAKAATADNNPVIQKDESMESGVKVTYKCIWFGTYPQTEIVDTASTCGIYGKTFTTKQDYEVNPTLYKTLQNATYDGAGDTTVDGTRYRRVKASQSYGGYTDKNIEDSDHGGDYLWKTSIKYHYFRFDPIKWRILSDNNNEFFLLADVVLDDVHYHNRDEIVTWEDCELRRWLNDSFENTAFTPQESTRIYKTNLTNYDSPQDINGGKNTQDEIFALSSYDVSDSMCDAASYGFDEDAWHEDEARRAKSSTYAKAMGVHSNTEEDCLGTCKWWLRTPGEEEDLIACAQWRGIITGFEVTDYDTGVRPALRMNAKIYSAMDSVYLSAGTVCTDGTMNVKCPGHRWSDADIIQAPTYKEDGLVGQICVICGMNRLETMPAVRASIKLSAKKKTLRRRKTYTLTIKDLANGDRIKSVKSSKKSVATVKKVKKNKYKIIAKGKRGKATITVTLKSGKKAKCKITVK